MHMHMYVCMYVSYIYRKPISSINNTRPNVANLKPNTRITALSRLGSLCFICFLLHSSSHATVSLCPSTSGINYAK